MIVFNGQRYLMPKLLHVLIAPILGNHVNRPICIGPEKK